MKKALLVVLFCFAFVPAAGSAEDHGQPSALPETAATEAPAGSAVEELSVLADAIFLDDTTILDGVYCCQQAFNNCSRQCPYGVAAFACTPTPRCSSTCACS